MSDGPATRGSALFLAWRIDALCDQFESACLAGQTPQIEDYLGQVSDAERGALRSELVALEREYRRREDAAQSGSTIAASADSSRSGELSRFRRAEPRLVLSRLGRFELGEMLGQGAFGRVYKAYDPQLDRHVALKVPAFRLQEGAKVQRFLAEAKAAARLRHPNIVPTYDSGQADGQYFIATQFIAGQTLSQRITRGRIEFQQAALWVRQLAEALAYAHGEGIIHRDIKPDNIMLDEKSVPQIMDFGLAKRLNDDAAMTTDGSILGTPAYMPPEQAKGELSQIGPHSDQYSLGVVLYELLTGKRPFEGTPHSVLSQVISTEPAAPRGVRSDIPRDLEAVCLKCLEKSSARRYASAQALADDLNRFLRQELVLVRPASAMERAWRWCQHKPLAAALALVATLLVGVLSIGGPLWAIREARLREIATQQTEIAKRQTTAAERAMAEANTQKFAAQEATGEANRQKKMEQEQRELAEWRLYVSQIGLAQREWEVNDVAAAWQHLEGCQESLRGWEYDYLYTLFTKGQQTFPGHRDGSLCVAFSPDGKWLASGGLDRLVKVWDIASGRLNTTLAGHMGTVSCVAFSPDGRWIASGGDADRSIRIWDVATGQTALTLQGSAGAVASVAYSPDGKRIVSGSGKAIRGPGEIRVWDTTSGQSLLLLDGHAGGTRSVAFSPDGATIASGGNDTDVKVWDAMTGQGLATLKGHRGAITSIAYSPDGNRIASVSYDEKMLKLWDATSRQVLVSTTLGGTTFTSVAFSPDGKRIASGGYKNVVVREAATGAVLRTFQGHTSQVPGIAFSPDGTQIASAGGVFDGTVKVWDTTVNQSPTSIKPQGSVAAPVLSPDGRRMAGWRREAGSRDRIVICDATSGGVVRALDGYTSSQISCIVFSPDGDRIASGDLAGELKVWDAVSGHDTLTLQAHSVSILSLAWSPDGNRLVSGAGPGQARGRSIPGGPGELKIWNAMTGEVQAHFPTQPHSVRSAAFSPDGKHILTAASPQRASAVGVATADPGELKIWDAASSREIMTLRGHSAMVTSLAYSPDGRRIVTGSADQTLKVWDAGCGQEMLALKGHTGHVMSVAFSPDGRRIASGGWDRTLKLWDAASGRETLALRGFTLPVNFVAFSPDGKRLISVDSGVRIWDAGEGQADLSSLADP